MGCRKCTECIAAALFCGILLGMWSIAERPAVREAMAIHRLPITAEARELSRCINYESRVHKLMRLRIPYFDTIASKNIVMLRHNISKFGKVYAIILISILALFLPNNRWKRDKAFWNRTIALAIGV